MKARRRIHIINPFLNALAGTELHALGLYDALRAEADVFLWSTGQPDPRLSHHPIRIIRPYRGEFPVGGTLILVGAFFPVGEWIRHARYERAIVIYNVAEHERLFSLLALFKRLDLPPPEIGYVAHWLRDAAGLEGRIVAEPIDMAAFRPALHPDRGFTVGRLSRDVPEKHHRDDPSLYKMLALSGCRIRIMGGTCLSAGFATDAENIELLPAGAEPAPDFLQSLDCFFYRTGLWREAPGRVVLEALVCGLPVVAHHDGGYAEWIREGENGFLIRTQEEAFDRIMQIKNDPALRQRLGQQAHLSAEEHAGAASRRKTFDWYLGSTDV